MSFSTAPENRTIDFSTLRTPALNNGIKVNGKFIQLRLSEGLSGIPILVIPNEQINGKDAQKIFVGDSIKTTPGKKFNGATIYNDEYAGQTGVFTIHYDSYFEPGAVKLEATVPGYFGPIAQVTLVADTTTLFLPATTKKRRVNVQNGSYDLYFGDSTMGISGTGGANSGFWIPANSRETFETKAAIYMRGYPGVAPSFYWNEEY